MLQSTVPCSALSRYSPLDVAAGESKTLSANNFSLIGNGTLIAAIPDAFLPRSSLLMVAMRRTSDSYDHASCFAI